LDVSSTVFEILTFKARKWLVVQPMVCFCAGCRFGNKSPVCRGLRLSNCSDSYINQTCCLLCANYHPPRVTTTLPTTTPSTTLPTSTPSGDKTVECRWRVCCL